MTVPEAGAPGAPAPARYEYDVAGRMIKKRVGSASEGTSPRNVYATSDGGWVAISASTQAMTERLFAAIGRDDLNADPKFKTNAERVKNREALIPLLEGIFKKKAAWQWEQVLKAHGVPCALYLRDKPRSHLVHDHPQTQANQMIETIRTPWGPCRVSRAHWRFSREVTSIPRPAPRLGEHQAEILRELGLTGVPARASAA